MGRALSRFLDQHRLTAHCLEMAVLSLCLVSYGLRLDSIPGARDFAVLVLWFLFLARVTQKPGLFLSGCYAATLVWYIGKCCLVSLPVLREIRADASVLPDDFQPGFPVPSHTLGFAVLIDLILPFLCGVYLARRSFKYWKFACGHLPVILLTSQVIAFEGSLPQRASTAAALTAGVFLFPPLFSFLVILLPLQRQSLERLFGFPLRPGQARLREGSLPFLSTLFAHFTLLLLIVVYALTLMVAVQTLRALRVEEARPGVHVNSALHNAFNDVRDLFAEDPKTPRLSFESSKTGRFEFTDSQKEGWISRRLRIPCPVDVQDFVCTHSRERIDAVFGEIDSRELAKCFQEMAPYFQALEQARQAQISRFQDSSGRVSPDYMNFRVASVLLGLRSLYHLHEGRPEQAISDIETILNTGWLLRDDSQLFVSCQVGNAVSQIGIRVAFSFCVQYRNDVDRLRLLKAMMERMSERVRLPLDGDRLRRREPHLWSLGVLPELFYADLPAFYLRHYSVWIMFDLLRLRVAAEEYRIDHGKRPASLEELLPQYLTRPLRDPVDGGTYLYRETEERCEIKWPIPDRFLAIKLEEFPFRTDPPFLSLPEIVSAHE